MATQHTHSLVLKYLYIFTLRISHGAYSNVTEILEKNLLRGQHGCQQSSHYSLDRQPFDNW